MVTLQKFLMLLGRYFQVRDDYKNLSGDYAKTKGFCEDLDEGKYSIILIYALQQKPENLQLANLLSYRKSSGKMTLEQKELVLKILHKSGAIDNTRLVLESLHNHTRDILRELETRFGCSNPEMEVILELLRV
ncbi:hypothetical protein ACKVWM_011418 [Pyricularia oryzae]